MPNRHDGDGLVAVFAEGGTYHNPRMDHALTGQAIANFAKSLWTAYSDASLEIISSGDTGGGLVATQWVLLETGPEKKGISRQTTLDKLAAVLAKPIVSKTLMSIST